MDVRDKRRTPSKFEIRMKAPNKGFLDRDSKEIAPPIKTVPIRVEPTVQYHSNRDEVR